jgi:putative adenylate-forming enzyme
MKAERLHIIMSYLKTKVFNKWSNRKALERWQENRLLRHLKAVRERSPFYRELWGDRPLSGWKEFPIIDKAIMMEHFNRLNTAGIRKEEAIELALRAEETREFTPMIGSTTVGLSSGTSGNRGLFLVSEKERLAWAGITLAKVLPQSLLSKQKIAFFLRANSNLYGTVSGGSLSFEFYDLLDSVEKHLLRLNEDPPTLLVAPPSMLRLLAEHRRAGSLLIHPERIVSVAEVLDPLDREWIEASFQSMVHQVYQCTEGFLAATCEHGTLHLNEDLIYIQKEWIDEESRRFVPIITDFTRLTQPIIRYRLNDILVEQEAPCACGSSFLAIERVEGRCDDLFVLPGAVSGWVHVFPDFISRTIITASDLIEAYQAILHTPNRLEISLLVNNGEQTYVEQSAREGIIKLFLRLGCRVPDIQFTSYGFQPSDRKLRRVERRFPLDASHSII